jgi:hypothetical protein
MIFISDVQLEKLLEAPTGTIVRGTFNMKTAQGAVVTVETGAPDSFVHPALGRTDITDKGMPLVFLRDNSVLQVTNPFGDEIPHEVYSAKDFYKRNPFDPRIVEYLNGRRILVVGLGSVGAEFSVALAQAGIASIAGTDPDNLEVHNCMRHMLGTEYIGWNKALAMSEYLKTACPGSTFVPLPKDLFSGDRDELKDFVDSFKPHAIVAVTDSKGVQALAQMLAIYAKALFFSMGCYSNAIEGEVFIRLPKSPLPDTDPVGYACHEELHPPGKGERPSTAYDYSNDAPGRYAGEPALGHLIRQKVYTAVTLFIHALMYESSLEVSSGRVTMQHLSRGAQYARLGGPYVTTTEETGEVKTLDLEKPWQVKWCRLRRHTDCTTCGDGVDVNTALYPANESDTGVLDAPEWDV